MRHPIIVILLLIFGFTQQATWAAERGALFRVEAKGHSMLLFGTMHMGLPEFYPLEARLTGALGKASALVLEIDPLQDPAAPGAALLELGMAMPGAMPPANADPGFRARLDRALLQAHIDPQAAWRFKPWLLATLLAVDSYASLGYRANLAVDLQLARLARDAKVPVLELESVRAQLGLFNRLTAAEQLQVLEDSVAMIESGRQQAEAREIVDAWAHADQAALDRIAAHAEQDQSFSGQFMQKVMLDERNGPMADKLLALLERQDHVVAAVGVLHLLGRHSIPALLRARGVTVERIY